MDLLIDDSGSTLIETLIGILILGIVATVTFSIYMQVYTSPTLLYKTEALSIANQEVTNCICNKVTSDTSYYNLNNNLIITRKVTVLNRIYRVEVDVAHPKKEGAILTMSGFFVK